MLPVFLLTMCGKKSHEPKSRSENTSTLTISILLDSELQNNNNRQAEKQISKARNLAENSGSDSLLLGVLEADSQLNYRKGEKDIFKKKNVQISKQAHQKKLRHIEAKSLFNIGNYYFEQSRYDSAYFYYTQSKDAALGVKDYKRVSSNMVNMAIIQTTVGDYNGSEQTSIEGLKITPDSCKNIKLSFYNNLGVISDELGDYKESLLWYDKALQLSKDSLQKLVFLNNMALVYKNENNFSKALHYLQQAEQMSDKNKFPDYDAMVQDNLGYIKYKNHQNAALEILLTAYGERQKIGNISGLIASELHLSEYWSEHDNLMETEKYALHALQNTYRVKDIKNRLKVLSMLSKKRKKIKYWYPGLLGKMILPNLRTDCQESMLKVPMLIYMPKKKLGKIIKDIFYCMSIPEIEQKNPATDTLRNI
jgi:tetratricopeptide (TPR) repeat protein